MTIHSEHLTIPAEALATMIIRAARNEDHSNRSIRETARNDRAYWLAVLEAVLRSQGVTDVNAAVNALCAR